MSNEPTWIIAPLQGKYYTTKIINRQTDEYVEIPSFLYDDKYQPSERELEKGWEADEGYDHVETERTYQIAKVIAAALNKALRQ